MYTVSEERFAQIVAEALDALPSKILRRLRNVAITHAPAPDVWQKLKLRFHRGMILLGLYEGIPRTARGNSYSFVLPDKITIFQRAHELIAKDEEDLKMKVKKTLWHEIGHHFGLDDEQIRQLEGDQGTRVKT